MYKPPVCHIILGRTGIGAPFWKYYFQLAVYFTCKSYGKKKKARLITHVHSANRNNGNRFLEQYEWTKGVCITVQIGERGTFTDVQIGERGKQRVKGLLDNYTYTLELFPGLVSSLRPVQRAIGHLRYQEVDISGVIYTNKQMKTLFSISMGHVKSGGGGHKGGSQRVKITVTLWSSAYNNWRPTMTAHRGKTRLFCAYFSPGI